MIGLHQMLPAQPLGMDLSCLPTAGQQQSIVRVAAKTAPQIVSSVPKCRKGSRSRTHEPRVGQQVPSANLGRGARQYPPEDQVLLIVNDDHLHGGGVPVIGRRLPSKSMSSMHAELQLVQSSCQQLDYSMAPTLPVGGDIQLAQPVLGRRRSRNQQYLVEEQFGPTFAALDTPQMGSPRNKHLLAIHKPVPVTEMRQNRRHASQSVSNLPAGHRHIKGHQRMPSSTRVGDQLVAQGRAVSRRLDMESRGLLASSCASLCCAHSESPQLYLASSEEVNCISPRKSPMMHEFACCQEFYPAGPMDYCKASYPNQLNRSLSCQRIAPSNECQVSPDRRGQPPASRKTRYSTNYEKYNRIEQAYNRPGNGPAQEYHIPARHPVLDTEGRRHTTRTKPAAPQPPNADLGEPEDSQSAAVSQMYESLAAELKAKLGDPKMGPILLPPKDYDTMSRKQGKLTGIELRRSTNPQLVGPTANRSSRVGATKKPSETIVEGKQPDGSTIDGSSSSRCSQELQRSCSNSSSGLGSISIEGGVGGGGSPGSCASSSKTLSDEDVHKLRVDNLKRHSHRYIGVQANNASSTSSGLSSGSSPVSPISNHQKSYSPDDVQSSDSGVASNTKFCDDKKLAEVSRRYTKQVRGFDSHHHPSVVSTGILWNGRVEVPLKINSEKNGNTYLATKQIIY